MKLKPTPFLLISACSILIAAWIIISGEGGNLVGLVVFFCIFITLLFFGLYYISARVFKNQFLKQFLVELLLVMIITFVYYRQNEKIILQIPRSFHGYILILYNVPGQPKLKTRNFFSPDIDITVPASGIIYTSSPYGKKIVLADSSQSKVKMLRPGHDIPFFNVPLPCETGKYETSIIVFDKLPPGWTAEKDIAKRNEKLRLACEMLRQK